MHTPSSLCLLAASCHGKVLGYTGGLQDIVLTIVYHPDPHASRATRLRCPSPSALAILPTGPSPTSPSPCARQDRSATVTRPLRRRTTRLGRTTEATRRVNCPRDLSSDIAARHSQAHRRRRADQGGTQAVGEMREEGAGGRGTTIEGTAATLALPRGEEAGARAIAMRGTGIGTVAVSQSDARSARTEEGEEAPSRCRTGRLESTRGSGRGTAQRRTTGTTSSIRLGAVEACRLSGGGDLHWAGLGTRLTEGIELFQRARCTSRRPVLTLCVILTPRWCVDTLSSQDAQRTVETNERDDQRRRLDPTTSTTPRPSLADRPRLGVAVIVPDELDPTPLARSLRDPGALTVQHRDLVRAVGALHPRATEDLRCRT